VRRAVERYSKIAEARPGDAPGERQQRVYDFLGDKTFTQFTGMALAKVLENAPTTTIRIVARTEPPD